MAETNSTVLQRRNDPIAVLDGWLTRQELAAEMGLSVDTLAKWASQLIGPVPVRVGSRVFYRRDAVRDWLISLEKRRAWDRGR